MMDVAVTGGVPAGTYGWNGLMNDVEVFLAALRFRGRRETTLRTYREALKSVFHTAESAYGVLPDPRTITSDDICVLRSTMTVCDNSKKLYLQVLGLFVESLTGTNPRRGAGILWNQDDRRRLFISAEQFKVLMYKGDPLDRLIVSLGAYMGLRRSEMAGLRLTDLENGHVVVRGKGHGPDGKVARLFMPVQVRRCVDAWLMERSRLVPEGPSDDHLLLSTGRNIGKPVSGNWIGDRVRSLGRRCGVDLTAHSLRRLFCTTMWAAGVDANTVRLMMRHSSIDTTMRCYVQASPESFMGARKALEESLD